MSTKSSLDTEAVQAPMKKTHESGAHLTLEWRLKQLNAMKTLLVKHEEELLEALWKDLHKNPVEAKGAELALILDEVVMCIGNVKTWMQPRSAAAPLWMFPSWNRIEPRPLRSPGNLIIVPTNYPLLLGLQPAVASLAAGNPTVIKPSEQCPASSEIMARLIPQYFDPGALQVVAGGIAETTALLKAEWGMIFFTGSARVGKIVAEAAAKTLTPTVLELGGKCPCVVDETAPSDINGIANRIIWAKTWNAGQTCVAIDYLVVHESMLYKLLPALKESLAKQFGQEPKESELGRMIGRNHTERQVELLKEAEASKETIVVCGGAKHCDVAEKYTAPTILLHPPLSCRVWKEEIFGPVLPIHMVKTRQQAIEFINSMPGTPLSMSIFTQKESVLRQFINACPSASVMRNDALVIFGSSHLPFGGLGTSGYGRSHGKFAFETFSHFLPVAHRPCVPGSDICMLRYHPFLVDGRQQLTVKAQMIVALLKTHLSIPVLQVPWLLGLMALALSHQYIPIVQEATGAMLTGAAVVLERLATILRSMASPY